MKLNYFQITMIDIQWLKLFLGFFFIPYYKWIGDISACYYCNFGIFGYWNGFIAPYGILWYTFYWGATRFGYTMFIIFIWMFDSAVFSLTLTFQSRLYTVIFTIISSFLFFISPADLLMFWFAILGKEAKIMSILSVITKLPWPAPLFAWKFIFTTSFAVANSYLGWPRYILLGLCIIHPAFYWIRWKIEN